MQRIITETSQYDTKDDYLRYSVSRIKCYKECSQMYKLKYVDKLDVYQHSNATLIGTLLHAALEYLYGTEDDEVQTAEDAFFKVLPEEFARLNILSLESILGDLLDYHNDISNLYLRASSAYTGIDAIRTGKGTVPKVPEMTGTWKSEVRRLDLDGRKERIDYVVQTSKGLDGVSITEVFSKAYMLASNYITPPSFMRILHLELPLSEWDNANNKLINPVPFPGCKREDVYLNGYIDNIAEVYENGKNVLSVIDYKTSKETFDENIVRHNQQLLLYAAAVEYLLERPVEYIGILSLTKGELVNVPVDREIQDEVIRTFNKVVDKTIEGSFYKHIPDTKYSTCLNSFGGTCPFLEHCWPKSHEFIYNTGLQDDLSVFLK